MKGSESKFKRFLNTEYHLEISGLHNYLKAESGLVLLLHNKVQYIGIRSNCFLQELDKQNCKAVACLRETLKATFVYQSMFSYLLMYAYADAQKVLVFLFPDSS